MVELVAHNGIVESSILSPATKSAPKALLVMQLPCKHQKSAQLRHGAPRFIRLMVRLPIVHRITGVRFSYEPPICIVSLMDKSPDYESGYGGSNPSRCTKLYRGGGMATHLIANQFYVSSNLTRDSGG